MSPAIGGALTVLGFVAPGLIAVAGGSRGAVRVTVVAGAALAALVAGPSQPALGGGFAIDAWRGMLIVALGIAAVAEAWISERDMTLVSFGAAGVASVLVAGHAAVAMFGVLVTATALAADAWHRETSTRNAIAEARARTVFLLVADLAVAVGIVVGAEQGLLAIPRLSGVAAWFIAAGVLTRLGVLVLATTARGLRILDALLVGIPAIAFAAWVSPGAGPARALALGGATLAVSGAWKVARGGDAIALTGPWLALAVVAIAEGSPALITAAIGFVAAAVIAPILATLAPGAVLATVALPSALAFPSAITLLDAMAAAAITRPEAALITLACAAAVAWLVVAAFAGVRGEISPVGGDTRTTGLVALAGLALSIGVAAPLLFAGAGRQVSFALGLESPIPEPRAPFEGFLLPALLVTVVASLFALRRVPLSSAVFASRGTMPEASFGTPPAVWQRTMIISAGLAVALLGAVIARSASVGWL